MFEAPSKIDGLVYNNTNQALVIPGNVIGGDLYYKVNDGEWSKELPSKKDAGKYEVAYKVIGKDNYHDIEEENFVVEIKKVDITVEALNQEVEQYLPLPVLDYKVTGLPAHHFEGDGALIYIIEQNGKKILYAHDTGFLYEETIDFIRDKGYVFDLVSLDCTNVDIPISDEGNHMGISNNIRLVSKLRECGAITDKTKVLILPYPCNPTGAVMRREDLEAIAEVLRGTDIVVLSDEIYAELTFGGKSHVSIASLPGMWERTVVVSGFSKAYAMTGWRLGYICAPAPLAKQMLKIHQYAIMCAPTTAQLAAITALRDCDEEVAAMTAEYDRRRRLIYNGLRDIGVESFEPEGAFYIYPNIGKFGLTSEEFCERLLYEHKVAIVPGTAFGACGEGFARVSYAYSVRHIQQAMDRLEAFLQTL